MRPDYLLSLWLLDLYGYWQGDYCAWCKANNFESMLPKDTAECHKEEKEKLAQSSLDKHVVDLTHQNRRHR